jgi:hypothetical protein
MSGLVGHSSPCAAPTGCCRIAAIQALFSKDVGGIKYEIVTRSKVVDNEGAA